MYSVYVYQWLWPISQRHGQNKEYRKGITCCWIVISCSSCRTSLSGYLWTETLILLGIIEFICIRLSVGGTVLRSVKGCVVLENRYKVKAGKYGTDYKSNSSRGIKTTKYTDLNPAQIYVLTVFTCSFCCTTNMQYVLNRSRTHITLVLSENLF